MSLFGGANNPGQSLLAMFFPVFTPVTMRQRAKVVGTPVYTTV